MVLDKYKNSGPGGYDSGSGWDPSMRDPDDPRHPDNGGWNGDGSGDNTDSSGESVNGSQLYSRLRNNSSLSMEKYREKSPGYWNRGLTYELDGTEITGPQGTTIDVSNKKFADSVTSGQKSVWREKTRLYSQSQDAGSGGRSKVEYVNDLLSTSDWEFTRKNGLLATTSKVLPDEEQEQHGDPVSEERAKQPGDSTRVTEDDTIEWSEAEPGDPQPEAEPGDPQPGPGTTGDGGSGSDGSDSNGSAIPDGIDRRTAAIGGAVAIAAAKYGGLI